MDGINPLSPSGFIGTATSQSRGWTGGGPQLPALGQLLKALVVEAQEGGRFLLDIGGNRLSASSTATLSQGQALRLQVVRTEPQIELKIITDNASPPLAGRSLTLLGKSVDVSALLQLKALVVETGGGDRLVVDIGGNKLAASSGAVLPQGQALQLQIVATEPRIELKIVDAPAPLAGRSLTLLDKSVDLPSLLQAVGQPAPSAPGPLTPVGRGVLESFFTLPPKILTGEDGGPALKQLIDHLGLNLEHLLALGDKEGAAKTLKAVLLDLLHNFGSTDRAGESAGKLISTLELFQLSQMQGGSEFQYLFPLPLPFVQQGYLLIERDGQGATGSNEPAERRFSLNMTMSDLGDLRIDFLHNAEGLFIKFAADSKDKAEFLAEFGDELKAAITAPLIGLTFAGGAPDPVSDLLRRLMPEGTSMLDTRV